MKDQFFNNSQKVPRFDVSKDAFVSITKVLELKRKLDGPKLLDDLSDGIESQWMDGLEEDYDSLFATFLFILADNEYKVSPVLQQIQEGLRLRKIEQLQDGVNELVAVISQSSYAHILELYNNE